MIPQPHYEPSFLTINCRRPGMLSGIAFDSMLNGLLDNEDSPDTLRKRIRHESFSLTSGMVWSESQPCTSIGCLVARALKRTWVLREIAHVNVYGEVRRRVYKLVVNYTKVKWLPAHHAGVTDVARAEPIKSNMDHLIHVTKGIPVSTSFLLDVDLGIDDLVEGMTAAGMPTRSFSIDDAAKILGVRFNWD